MKPFFDEEMLKKGEGEVLTYYVMGITPGGFENPTMVALVDSSGQLVKSLTLRNFRSKILEEKQKDDEALKELIVDYQPKVIGIACEGKDSFHVYSDVEKVINEEDIPYRPGLEHVSGEVARLYMDSGSATEEFPNVPSRMRHAISVARRVANPLAEIANLTCVEDDLSMLKLHSEQRFLSNKKLNLRLAEELVDVVSSVGVRINEVLDHGNLESLVQYLPGFGPRKAKSFIEACRRRGQVLNRFELVTQFGMGPRVFTNVSAFLRFDLVDRNFGDGEVKVLDETRIHPESYELTKKIAQDVLDEFEDAENDECVETLLRDPQRSAKLDLLDLDKFANLLEKEGKGNNRLLLYDIKHELCFPFRDTRKSYSPLRSDERFELVTGQSVSSFESLSLVTARVTRVFPDFAYCRVDEVIDGRINRNNVSDSLIEKVTDHLQVGQTLQAVVLHTNIENIQLYLSCKRSDIESALRREVERKDHYFDTIKCKQDTEALQAAERKKLSLEQRNHRRVVNHPLFKNLNYQEAEEFLSPLEMGDCVIRPSCSKKNELALTWKVDEGVYQHISIEDFTVDKEAHSLEGKYKLKKQFYDDLDEILARFLSPITALLTEVQNSQCYHKPLYKAELDKVLREEKKRNPARIPYYLSASKEFAGKLMISYLPGCNTVIHEFVVLSPEGFTYRNNLFDCVKDVIDWFKEYQKKKIKELQYLQQVNQFQEKQKTSKRRESRRYSHRKSEGKVNESRRYRSSYEKYSKSRQISVPSHSGSYSRNKSYSDYRY
ncbi:transcription elongation factor SPT6-like [Zophobas morio]|uniref:transcription elongation factor SPT6-like n=1 Tax=Zophobas morio TaxID=2755281 RepID=UPI003083D85D